MSLYKKILLTIALLSGLSRGFSATGPQVALVVDAPTQASEWQAVLNAELSGSSKLQLVERKELSRLLEDRERSALATQSSSEGGLSPLGRVNYYLQFRQVTLDSWSVSLVEAATSRLVATTLVSVVDFKQSRKLAQAAEGLLAGAVSGKIDGKPKVRVAVMESVVKGDKAGQTFILAARIRGALAAADFDAIDRALTQELVIEHNEADRGMRDASATSAFLGADYLIELVPQEKECDVRIIETRQGKLAGSRRFAFDGTAVMDQIQPWLFPLLGRAKTEKGYIYLPTVEVEALEPFYRGLALFDAGRFVEASNEFSRAYLCNGKFRDALYWQARCYDALGMKPLGEAVRRFAEICLVGRNASATGRTNPTESLAFLGVKGEPADLASVLSAMAASALSSRSDRGVRLPESLDSLRREYDWMAGVEWTDGMRWEQSQSLFCRVAVSGNLEVKSGRPSISWISRDTVTGKILHSESQELSASPPKWPEEIAAIAGRLAVPITAATQPALRLDAAEAQPVSKLESTLRSSRGLKANVALLNLALAAPDNKFVTARSFEMADSKRNGLDAFLTYAMRDWVITKLPEGDVRRRWLELMGLCSYLPSDQTGRFYSGKSIDVLAELQKFSLRDPFDPAGLTARYISMYERQSSMPYAELAAQCDRLLSDLERVTPETFPDARMLMELTLSTRDYALVASGDVTKELADDHGRRAPHQVKAVCRDDGTIRLEYNSNWRTNEVNWFPLSGEEKIKEARVAILINGRSGEFSKADGAWLRTYPNSVTLCSFVQSCLHELNWTMGLPIQHPFDWAGEKASYFEMIRYASDAIEYWANRATTADQLDNLEEVTWRFIMALNDRALINVYPDSQYGALQQRLTDCFKKADGRVGRPGWRRKQARILAWQEVTRAMVREGRKDMLYSVPEALYDRTYLVGEIERASQNAAVSSPNGFNPVPWWERLRESSTYDTFSTPEIARFYQQHTPDVLRLYDTRDLTYKEMCNLLEHGLALLGGGIRPEAEIMFRKIIDTPVNDLNRFDFPDAIRANAALRLTQILRLNGQIPEAIEMAKKGLSFCSSGPCFIVDRNYGDYMADNMRKYGMTGDMTRHLIRLLNELRFNPERADLPPQVGVVSVPTPNGDNPLLHVFYRVPSKPADGGARRRVLVIVPSVNEEVLYYLAGDSEWARFADARNLVLVAPRFYSVSRLDRASHLFAGYEPAHIWSGKALVDALAAIDKKTPIQKDHLLIHSFGAGTAFSCRFAMWRPDLVSAVSANGCGWGVPRFDPTGAQPMSALQNIHFLVTGAQADDFSADTQNRYAETVHLATRLRGEGISVEWKELPGVPHTPTPEMEELSRQFLGKQ